MSRRDRDRRMGGIDGSVAATVSTENEMPAADYQPVVQSNRRRLDAAHSHLDALFERAELPQIGGRKFSGMIRLEIVFCNGEASDVLTSIEQRDSCVGGGF